MADVITLDYGSGGQQTSRLISEMILPRFKNAALDALGDAAVIDGASELVFSTDSFVVSPAVFPGGDIGKLAVCGTVNDVCMGGGKPLYLSLSLIIEEGLPLDTLESILDSAARTAEAAGVQIVTGDTKVVERGNGDGIYINTAGIGEKRLELSTKQIREGDAILVSGNVGDHGTAVLLARNPGLLDADIRSDCAPLYAEAEALAALGDKLRCMRDPTRGGVATTINEFAEDTGLGIALTESAIPVDPSVRAACDLLGIDPLYAACEGRLLAVVSQDAAEEAFAILKRFRPEAAIIGHATSEHPGKVLLRTKIGAGRILAKLSGAQLPRIC